MKAYAFQAALYCEPCAEAIIAKMRKDGTEPPGILQEDSGHFPQGPYSNGGGEADCPQHCDACGAFLENPLTSDGEKYVRDAFAEKGPRYLDPQDPRALARAEVIRTWREHYDYL